MPELLITRPAKVATPPRAVAVLPDIPGLPEVLSVIASVAPVPVVTTWPVESSIETATFSRPVPPATVVEGGSVVKTSLAGGPTAAEAVEEETNTRQVTINTETAPKVIIETSADRSIRPLPLAPITCLIEHPLSQNRLGRSIEACLGRCLSQQSRNLTRITLQWCYESPLSRTIKRTITSSQRAINEIDGSHEKEPN
jgi:hypothetical protein